MADDELYAALENVERTGDISGSHDPRSAVMRSRVEREHLATRDDESGRYVLTTTGRQRLMGRHAQRPRPRDVVTPFRRPVRSGS